MKLKEIEKDLHIHNELAPSQIKWLIKRIKQLESEIKLALKQENQFTARALLQNALEDES